MVSFHAWQWMTKGSFFFSTKKETLKATQIYIKHNGLVNVLLPSLSSIQTGANCILFILFFLFFTNLISSPIPKIYERDRKSTIDRVIHDPHPFPESLAPCCLRVGSCPSAPGVDIFLATIVLCNHNSNWTSKMELPGYDLDLPPNQ